ncbi:cation/H(+) antiporter 4-like [Humulus lupulus]|uniref:cation/H(+) antiporter 4-like n=1 Tax=Humulus lupulus TaxID=3486 RepID=UPI002B4172A6|nr:cation/H(+) antiporter 4-like [Humulus lupulus]
MELNDNPNSNNIPFNTCIELPPQVNSQGFWKKQKPDSDGLLKNSLPELELQMVMVFCLSHTFHFVFKRFGIPKLSSDILTGLVLGYALMDEHGNPRDETLFTPTGQQILATLSMCGFALFLFTTGVKMNIGMVTKSGTKTVTIGVATLFVPFLCGLITKEVIARNLSLSDKNKLSFVFITQCLVPFPVISSLVSDLNLLNSEIGRLSMSSAMVSDAISFFLTAAFLIIRVSMDSLRAAIIDAVATTAFIVVSAFVIRPIMFFIIEKTPEGRPVKDIYVYTIIALALLSCLISDVLDQQIFMGPYLLGLLAIPDGPPLGSAIVAKLDCFVTGVFVPLFVSTSVLRVDLRKFVFDNLTATNAILVMVTNIAKFVACYIACFIYDMPTLDSWVLSFIMSTQGNVQIGLYTSFRDIDVSIYFTSSLFTFIFDKHFDIFTNNCYQMQGISESVYNLLVISILCLATIVPLSVKFLYDPSRKYAGYQKRNIMHLKSDSELRILVCIHRPDDIPAMINLLDASCPTKEAPIGVYVLHLIELIGRASPIFISHQVQKKALSQVSYSHNVILSFKLFENSNWDAVEVNVFTAVSPRKLMHEDICIMALDKLTSLMILPFHRKWSPDGHVELDDGMLRALNNSVLQRAPCSVGILVTRANSGRTGSLLSAQDAYRYSVAMVFLGGKDDREALTYAKRMVRVSSVRLTVIHLIAPDEEEVGEEKKWGIVLDAELLKDVKYKNLNSTQYIEYVQEVVNDGTQMASVVRGLVDEFDLVITGRCHSRGSRQISGLDIGWTEFPELGIIGDLLASMDIHGKASVLVIQQQEIEND